jgi:hypothetical protein
VAVGRLASFSLEDLCALAVAVQGGTESPSPCSHSDAIVDGLADDLGRARPFSRWRRVRRHPFPCGFTSCIWQNTAIGKNAGEKRGFLTCAPPTLGRRSNKQHNTLSPRLFLPASIITSCHPPSQSDSLPGIREREAAGGPSLHPFGSDFASCLGLV